MCIKHRDCNIKKAFFNTKTLNFQLEVEKILYFETCIFINIKLFVKKKVAFNYPEYIHIR